MKLIHDFFSLSLKQFHVPKFPFSSFIFQPCKIKKNIQEMKKNQLCMNKIDLLERFRCSKIMQVKGMRAKSQRHSKQLFKNVENIRIKSAQNRIRHPFKKDAKNLSCSSLDNYRSCQSNPEEPKWYKQKNSNYRSFPQRILFTAPYVIKNSDIVVSMFTKRIDREEKLNEFLAKKISLQFKNDKETTNAQSRSNRDGRVTQNSRVILSERFMLTQAPQSKYSPWDVSREIPSQTL